MLPPVLSEDDQSWGVVGVIGASSWKPNVPSARRRGVSGGKNNVTSVEMSSACKGVGVCSGSYCACPSVVDVFVTTVSVFNVVAAAASATCPPAAAAACAFRACRAMRLRMSRRRWLRLALARCMAQKVCSPPVRLTARGLRHFLLA